VLLVIFVMMLGTLVTVFVTLPIFNHLSDIPASVRKEVFMHCLLCTAVSHLLCLWLLVFIVIWVFRWIVYIMFSCIHIFACKYARFWEIKFSTPNNIRCPDIAYIGRSI
jgi:hypothetical protein